MQGQGALQPGRPDKLHPQPRKDDFSARHPETQEPTIHKSSESRRLFFLTHQPSAAQNVTKQEASFDNFQLRQLPSELHIAKTANSDLQTMRCALPQAGTNHAGLGCNPPRPESGRRAKACAVCHWQNAGNFVGLATFTVVMAWQHSMKTQSHETPELI